MCGIAGLVVPDGTQISRAGFLPSLQRAAEHMAAAPYLRRRGPDATRIVSLPHGRGYFVGTRLAITDSASPQAALPMTCGLHQHLLTYNGELYNHCQLRADLQDYPFRTRSDSEVLLAAYNRWGHHMFEKLEGMYAFALFDVRSESLLLAVDHAGQKPLVFSEITLSGHTVLAFASDQETLLRSGLVEPLLDTHALSIHFAMRYTPGTRTVWQNIRKLENGTFALCSQSTPLTFHRHFLLDIPTDYTSEESVLKARLRESVEIAEQEVTGSSELDSIALLSGGIDSSALVALAHRRASIEHPVHTLTLGAEHGTSMADETAEALSFLKTLPGPMRNHTVHASKARLTQALQEWTNCSPEPLFSRDVLGLLLLLREAHELGFRVVVTGCGPDEYFEGYTFTPRMQGLTTFVDQIPQYYFQGSCFLYDVELPRLFCQPLDELARSVGVECERILSLYPHLHSDSYLQAIQALNWHTRSQFECSKSDLVGGHFSLECRKPYYHRHFVHSCFQVPGRLKLHNGVRKYLMREAFGEGIVPREIANREKIAFTTPPVRSLGEITDDPHLLEGPLFSRDILSRPYVEALVHQGTLPPAIADQIAYYNHTLTRMAGYGRSRS